MAKLLNESIKFDLAKLEKSVTKEELNYSVKI